MVGAFSLLTCWVHTMPFVPCVGFSRLGSSRMLMKSAAALLLTVASPMHFPAPPPRLLLLLLAGFPAAAAKVEGVEDKAG